MATDYELIAKALRLIAERYQERPSLAELAQAVGLSEWHFQRKFTDWAGVSPKRFMQTLTVEYAKRQIARSRSLLDAAWNTGLSSGARLHDLFVTLEAVTPGEFARAGAGVVIRYGAAATPFGTAFLARTPRGICRLEFADGDGIEPSVARLRAEWPEADLTADPDGTQGALAQIFGTAPRAPLCVQVRGTNFQVQVWRALLAIPAGHALTYGDVAALVGKPGAARAVGQAVGANPVAYLIPCHRVIRELGVIGSYRWGAERKLALWGREAAARAAAAESVAVLSST